MRFSRKSVVLPLVFALSACSSDPVDIGDDRVVKTGEKLSDYAAVWEGYAEAYEFDSGSDRIKLTLDENGAGTLEVGDAPPIPAATDPDLDYPVGTGGATGPNVGLRSGYAYGVLDASVEVRRLRLGIDLYELYGDWCAMQTPYVDQYGAYGCLPNGSISNNFDGTCDVEDPVTEESLTANCGKVGMCVGVGVCACTADGCGALQGGAATRLDAALDNDGEELEGTFQGATIRMMRQ
jgi:hypothetical protein